NNPITTGITVDKATLTLKKKESAEVEGEEILEGTITASVFGMDQEPEITWEISPADQTAVTLSGTTGKTITVTAVGTAKATVTITAKCTYEGNEYTVPCEVKLKIMPIATLKVGDYVNYTPDTGTYKVADGETGSGRDTTDPGYQEFTTGSNLSWRVWSIKENAEGDIEEVEIVLARVGPSLYLKGADGYNHAVDILNDLCETLYSKTKADGTKVATGRSINVEDINSKTTYSPIGETNTSTGSIYGETTKQLSKYGTGYMKYPNLYSQEIGYGTAGTFNTTGLDGETGLKNGTTDERKLTTYPAMGFTDGNTAGTDPYVTHTYYGYNGSSYTYYPDNCLDTSLGVNTAPAGLIKLSSSYWLASRCVNVNSGIANFDVRYMYSSGNVDGSNLFNSNGFTLAGSLAVRPVVTLRSNVSLEYDSTKSTSSTTYWTAVFED
ncbi:MAG: hypothetical protein J6A29_06090, partial [Clostridia bacterium]|nr:hypothetical protein [Clostridia bacterium]